MADASKNGGDLMEPFQGMRTHNPARAPQLEEFWKAQDHILEKTEAFTKAWFERRHDSALTALEAVFRANGNGADPLAAMQAMVDWQQQSFRRMAEDVQEWIELCSNCAVYMTQAEIETEKDGVDDAAKRPKSAAKTTKATPV